MSPLLTISRRDETYRGSRCESVPCKLSRTWGSECFCVDPLICFGNQTLPLKLLLAPKSFSLLSCQLRLGLGTGLGARMLTAERGDAKSRVRLRLGLPFRSVKYIRFNSRSANHTFIFQFVIVSIVTVRSQGLVRRTCHVHRLFKKLGHGKASCKEKRLYNTRGRSLQCREFFNTLL